MIIEIAKEQDLKDIVNIYNQAIEAKHKTADLSKFKTEDRKVWFENHQTAKYPLFVAKNK